MRKLGKPALGITLRHVEQVIALADPVEAAATILGVVNPPADEVLAQDVVGGFLIDLGVGEERLAGLGVAGVVLHLPAQILSLRVQGVLTGRNAASRIDQPTVRHERHQAVGPVALPAQHADIGGTVGGVGVRAVEIRRVEAALAVDLGRQRFGLSVGEARILERVEHHFGGLGALGIFGPSLCPRRMRGWLVRVRLVKILQAPGRTTATQSPHRVKLLGAAVFGAFLQSTDQLPKRLEQLEVGLLDALVLLVQILKLDRAARGPLGLVGPVCRARLTLGDVLGMAGLEGCALLLHGLGLALLGLACRAGTLLAEADDLLAAVDAGLDHMRLGRVARRAAWLVEREAVFVDHFFLAALMLSTKLG